MAAKKGSSGRSTGSGGQRTSRRGSGARTGGKGGLPRLIYAQASPRSVGGVSLFDASASITSQTAPNFFSEDQLIQAAALRLQESGFQVLQLSATTINIAAPAQVYERVFETELTAEERPVIKPGAVEDTATFIDTPSTDLPGLVDTSKTPLGELIEGVAIEEPVYFMENALAPLKEYWHLRVPGDVSLGVNADQAHRGGTTGRGVKVVMVDSGWYRHPYFTQRGYRSSPVVLGPAAASPNDDESGHGTGESANAFAAAPDIDFTMVKINFVNSTGAFNAAVALAPQIISCSWGSSVQTGPLSAANQALAAAISTAVASGIVVVFSAGNGHWGFPGQHPDVISAGGVHMQIDGSLRASDYSSGFASNVYSGRNTPDLSGLVGMQPGASYIMLPVQPKDDIDTSRAGGTWPPQDQTAGNDGWAAFSGTSAAAPQVAGVCALIKDACPNLSPTQVRDILKKSARDVTAGTNHPNFGNAAGTGYDLATGAGLVDAHKAVLMAKLRCLGPIKPPITPPIQPVKPVKPIQPIQPIQPIEPIQPVRPIQPVILPPPLSEEPAEGAAAGTEAGGSQLSADDVEAIERLIVEGDIDL